MRPRQLKKILTDIQNEYSVPEKETASYRLAKSSIKLSTVFSFIAIIFVIYQICTSPDKQQMSHLINKTDTLITKQGDQIDSLKVLNNKLAKQLRVAKDQYNMNAEIAAFKSRDYLSDRYNSFNNIVEAIADMQHILVYHRFKMEGKMTLKYKYVDKRIEAIDYIRSCFRRMGNIGNFVDDKSIISQYNSSLSALLQYKIACHEYIALFGKVDTSVQGQNTYDSVMNNIVRLNDRILPVLDIGRANIQKQLNDIKTVIRINDSLRKLSEDK